jgi:8-oxo-dGTP pyrophosphatase MutT (NUDIX family)
LTENELHAHYPLYHSTDPNSEFICPICQKVTKPNDQVHIHNKHGPIEEREPKAPEFAAFSWVIIRRDSDGKFAMVNEPAGLAGGKPRYWLPAGRVDSGETLIQAGVREAKEEAGLDVTVTGVLRFMMSGSTPRVVLFAKPKDETQAIKSLPDFESVGAVWVNYKDLEKLNDPQDYRSNDPIKYFGAVESGKLVPMSTETMSFCALDGVVSSLTSKFTN